MSAAERAVEYIHSEFDEDVAEARAKPYKNEVEIGLYPPKGFLDPVNVDKLRELGFELKSIYTTTDTTRKTIVDFQFVAEESKQ